MHKLMLLFSLNFGGSPATRPPDRPGDDRWLSADKAKHFFTAAFVQSVAYSGFRVVGASHKESMAGATLTSSAISIGKEVYDAKFGGDPSLKDLAWDGAGILAATALLAQTKR